MNDAEHSPNTSQDKNQLSINVEQQSIIFCSEDKTLLNSLEKNDIEVHYHCRDGFCGACRVTLIQGEICYPNGEPLAFVGENEILPCCCIPVTNITLEID